MSLSTLSPPAFDPICYNSYLRVILGSNSVVSGNSSRSRSHGSLARSPNQARSGKVRHWCGCGMRPVLRWSGTEANPDRPFFGCPNYNIAGKRWCGLFVWADVEEEECMPGKNEEQYGSEFLKKNLSCRISNIEDLIRKLKRWIGVLTLLVLCLSL
ncbi:hypothetical protein PIB30_047696 [Stylosanthes scabra]|uniref:GRF-type domain-containing protein n=1 Tax=Stylosanthes scabra TaxID=79078 RepID=A0ABU6QG73_9FABA|nr:hypothetical protein [Stylosanthes scabra]